MAETKRIVFDQNYIEKELKSFSFELPKKVNIILIGGANMIYRGLKAATKDIDIVFSSQDELKVFSSALKKLGYYEVLRLTREYTNLGASRVMRNHDGFQCDMFYHQVCRGLVLTSDIVKRTEVLSELNNLTISLMSPEDIFLFKGITERSMDLDDMRILIEHGLDWEIILNECLNQSETGRRLWEAFLLVKLNELHEKFGIFTPITRRLTQVSEHKMFIDLVLSFIKKEKTYKTYKEIFEHIRTKYDFSESWVRKNLSQMVKEGILKKEKRGIIYYYHHG